MPFSIVRNDITRMQVDAIVNSAAPHLLGDGGADGAIHRAAGPELKAACRKLGGCKTGQVKPTPGFRLPCRYVFHTVGPVWMGGIWGEEEKLRSCYRNALELAAEMRLESIAFPLISSGLFRFPREKALRVAMDEIGQFVLTHDMQVCLVVYDRESFRISSKLMQDIHQYIDDRYVEERHRESLFEDTLQTMPLFTSVREARQPFAMHQPEECNARQPIDFSVTAPQEDEWQETDFAMGESDTEPYPAVQLESYNAAQVFDREMTYSTGLMGDACIMPAPQGDNWQDGDFATQEPGAETGRYEQISDGYADHEDRLRRILQQQDEGFSQRLLRMIDQRGMTDPECYRRANIDRRLFSKIRNNSRYQPSKQTALAFAVALRLNRRETDELLQSAGLALSHSSRFDLVVEYFINEGVYDVIRINEALYAFDLPLLGN